MVAYSGCDLVIEIWIECEKDIYDCNVVVIIYDLNAYRVIDVNTALNGHFLSLKVGQEARVEFHIHELLLKPGIYFVGLWLGIGGTEEIDYIEHVTKFNVIYNPELIKHIEVFPGVYLCKFDDNISIKY